ncbi:MAG TPA: heavy metal-responsive transcriptional regulator [Acidimicrobiales bacterium]|nr:heavy metal-responsive transcriptional regulator [Acidimicrobiales bacterium]
MGQMTVSKLADQVGTSPDTLRYYERIGLLAEPDRSASGYRLYGDDAVERVRFIKRAQRFGLRLDEIGELLDIRQRGLCPCGRTRRLLEAKVAELDEEMATLARLRDDISRMIVELPVQEGDGSGCGSDLIQLQPTKRSDNRNRRTT